MTPSLNLSVNELASLLRQVGKATYTAHHDYITIRRTLLWMEVQGFDGLDAVLGDFTQDLVCPRPPGFGDDPLTWSLAGASLIPVAHMAGDILIAESVDNSTLQMSIHKAKNPSAFLREMERFMVAGLSATLIVDGQVLARCRAGNLKIFCGASDWPNLAETLVIKIGDEAAPKARAVLTLNDINARRTQAYDEGITVSSEIYGMLNKRAALCLVPSTEASRRGAGE